MSNSEYIPSEAEFAPAAGSGRRDRARLADLQLSSKQPANPEAEAGVLGCVLISPEHGVQTAREVAEFFQGRRVFHDLRYATIWEAMLALVAAPQPALDLILLQTVLRDRGQLDQVGGLAVLIGLQDVVPSYAAVMQYAEIVWECFQRREFIASSVSAAAQAQAGTPDGLEPIVSRLEAQVLAIKESAARHGGLAPSRVKSLFDYGEQYWDLWFGAQAEEPGLPLPFEFPFKIRRGEQTFFIADKGAGKSTLMSFIRLHMMHHGMRAGVASMEMRPEVTIKIAAAQLLGTTRLPDNAWGQKQAKDAFTWLNERMTIYDFLGIADWRDILHAFNYLAERGTTFFEIDSVMRLGIPDDDLAQQGLAAAQFAQFAMSRNVHLVIINHLNKSDRHVKQRSRGSQQWIDNSHNVISIERNEKKHAELEDLEEKLRLKELDYAAYTTKKDALRLKYDTYFQLHNQRWQGSQQNGSRYLYFNRGALQLTTAPQDPAINFLERWTKREEREQARAAESAAPSETHKEAQPEL